MLRRRAHVPLEVARIAAITAAADGRERSLALVATNSARLTGYAHLAARLSHTLKRRRSARAVNGTVGAALLALGLRLGFAPH